MSKNELENLRIIHGDDGCGVAMLKQAKEMEKKQKINLPIHIHEGVENIHVYVENGVIHVKRND
jgi:hypothetical protein